MFSNLFNRLADRLIHPQVRILGKLQSTFLICGYIGLSLAILLSVGLVLDQGLSPWVMLGVVATAVLTFLALAMVARIITGEEQLTYFHHEIAVLFSTTVFLWLLHQPMLGYLDATILGLGLFVACGRVGCLMVGCCHGRPHQWGVCYRDEHVKAGFPAYLAGVRIFPIQAIESLWLFGTVIIGSLLVLNGYPAGVALAWYLVVYGIGRFSFEFLRGDPARPYKWGFSEAQWTALIQISLVTLAGVAGLVPFSPFAVVAMSSMAIAMLALSLHRRLGQADDDQLLHPRHIKEIAEVVNRISQAASGEANTPIVMDIQSTSVGIRISASRVHGPAGPVNHYALSSERNPLNEKSARILADLIVKLRHPEQPSQVLQGNHHVFHVLVHSQADGVQR